MARTRPLSLEDQLATIARAWFPEPEFKVATQFSLNRLVYNLNVHHLATHRAFDAMYDEDFFQVNLNHDQHKIQMMESLAHKVHADLVEHDACQVVNLIYQHPGWEEIDALLKLTDFQVRLRHPVQGIGNEDDTLHYLFDQKKTVARLLPESMLRAPFETWQHYISAHVNRRMHMP